MPAGAAHSIPSGPNIAAKLDAADILASVGAALYHWDIESDALVWSPNVLDVLCVADVATISTGRRYAQLLDAANVQARFDAVMQTDQRDEGRGGFFQTEYCIRPDSGSGAKLWIEDSGRWFAGAGGRPARVHGTVRVVTERHESDSRLSYLAYHDSLTGELNRHQLTVILEKTLGEAMRSRSSCGFLLVAIDNLGRINDSYGFDIADEVIAAVAKRIRGRMRGKDSLGRYSGTKFGIVLTECTPDDMATAADRLLAGVRDEMVPTAAGPVAVTVTIGGVTAPRHARSVPEVLARAKEGGARRGEGQAAGLILRLSAQSRARRAAPRQHARHRRDRRRAQRTAHLPCLRNGGGEHLPAFYECLMRVRRTDGTLLGASDVVPVAERLGLVRFLDHRVLELVVSELAAAPALQASVNVSPASTTDPDWWAGLDSLLRTHAGVSERLIVEITESAAIHDVDETRGFVARVKDLGCRIAIDDFGAGYTSFRNLRKLGVDIVKIDGAFVENLIRSEDDRAFVRTLIDLARRLGLATVAEWVQDERTAKTLEAWGCEYLQGAHVGLTSLERPWLASRAQAV
ncbi:MAG TPA: GGDEF and EAL domain-containing protein [Xanthobacteraceae bacterium]|nr:GGDEF and EAL domain-containing protein [Xanthobacteraceae bacterium]